MDRRTFSTAAIGVVSAGLLMPLSSVHAAGMASKDATDLPMLEAAKNDQQTSIKARATKTQEQETKAPGIGKNQKEASKSPASGKVMESKAKSPMPDTKVRTDKTGIGATYWPAEAERKRLLALEHIAARRFG